MKYARVIDNFVREVFIEPAGFTIQGCFTPEIAQQFIQCPDHIEANWTIENGVYVEPVVIEIKLPLDS